MNKLTKSKVNTQIQKEHENDKEQMDVILSKASKVMVESPAGYGKTKTMINKIKYFIINNQLPKNKKILCLTFSVNSTDKIEKDIRDAFNTGEVNHRKLVRIGNYHSVALNILSKYGYLISDKLKEMEELVTLDEKDKHVQNHLNANEKKVVKKFNDIINDGVLLNNFYKEYVLEYNSIIKNKLLPANIITYNSYLTLCIELFKTKEEIESFYQIYYPIIIIDEFQDTNILSLLLINSLINSQTKLYLFGDSLQRIYGFMGAIPNLIDVVTEEHHMEYIKLKNNYRFKDNHNMLVLNNNIRENIKIPKNPNIIEDSKVNVYVASDQENEAKLIYNLIKEKNLDNKNLVILFRSRNKNTKIIFEYLNSKSLKIYNGLFQTTDSDYKEFHKRVNRIFIDYIKTQKRDRSFTRRDIKRLVDIVTKELYKDIEIFDSYIQLLNVFLDHSCSDYSYDYRNDYIQRVLQNQELKNYLNFIEDRVVITTIHSAKGLEWEYVILPDMESGIFPNDYWTKKNPKTFIDELCVFYVAFTRAQKEVYYTASKREYGAGKAEHRTFDTNISSFLSLPGIILNKKTL